ncbi:glycosyltransferase [Pelagibacteraceae bacterium]|nr:glycosyltransferase [Pelagibacteraceae bacterium]
MKINKIAILWESETGGGVSSFLKYLLQSKSFNNKKIIIFTNTSNKGVSYLKKQLSNNKNTKFVFYNSYFIIPNQGYITKRLFYFLKPIFLIISIFKFKKLFKKYKFDILICFCGNYGSFRTDQAALLATNNLLNIKKKCMVICHECMRPPRFMKTIFKIIDFYLKKVITSIVTISAATKKSVKLNSNLIVNDSYVIHCGVPINPFNKKNYLRKLLRTNSKIIIGMISQLTVDKNHQDLFFAFSKLPERYKRKMTIVIVGENIGNQKFRLKELTKKLNIENKVEFLNFVDIDSRKIILSFDLFLSLTKNFEGFGLSIAEAMSAGVPVLATDVGAVKEFFNSDCGKLIPPGNIDKIKNFLISYCDNKKYWKKKSKNGKIHINKHFNSEIMGKKYIEHLTSIKK